MIDPVKLRAARSAVQGLESSIFDTAPFPLRCGEISRGGWIRGVGSCTPYFHARSRVGMGSQELDQAVAEQKFQELPAARGCTYIVGWKHFDIALAFAHFPGDELKLEAAERRLGVTQEQLKILESNVQSCLKTGSADPRQIREELGDKVTSYGDEGKKFGLSTDLPSALRRLQLKGKIRRVPTNGRLDNERYTYVLWPDSPLTVFEKTKSELHKLIASLYFGWIGPATIYEFQWFTGFSKRTAIAAIQGANLLEVAPGYFLPNHRHFDSSKIYSTPNPQFLTCLDNLIMLTRNLALHIDETDRPLVAQIEGKPIPKGSLFDLDNHPIFDRGRLVGLWAYDQPSQELVYTAWGSDKDLIAQRAAETQTFVKEQLGDARSFSMDSTKSRQPRINLLREQPNYHG
ncbi:MAG: DNA glycosylase AlkZ-like family protein [Fimbriimonadaceae bacterium]